MKLLAKIAFGALFFYIFIVAYLYIQQRKLIYHPPQITHNQISHLITIEAEKNLQLSARYFPPKSENMPVILFFHGNAEDISMQISDIKSFIAKGYGVLQAEYRGYFGNAGHPTEKNLKADAQKYWDYLMEQGITPARVILYGRSLGGAVATHLANKVQPAGLILVVPFDSLLNVVKHHYPFVPFAGLLLKDQYDNYRPIEGINSPVLFVLAGADEVIPVHLGKALYDKAPRKKELIVIEDAGHNTVYTEGALNALNQFVQDIETAISTGESP